MSLWAVRDQKWHHLTACPIHFYYNININLCQQRKIVLFKLSLCTYMNGKEMAW